MTFPWHNVDRNGPVPEHCPGLGPCWVWTRFLKDTGYGQLGRPLHGTRRAHVAAFVEHHGRHPTGCVLHRCDNRACVRPEHLFEGSKRDNTHDMLNKGRHRYVVHPGVANGNAKLTEDDVRAIRGASGTLHQIAANYGVSFGLIWRIRRGLSWRHVA